MNDGKHYEEIARQILDEQREFFGLVRVAGKQDVPAVNGTSYEIDVVAYRKGDERLVLFECRDRNRRLTKEEVGGFAYRILRTGAETGYIVTPIGLQSGARAVADYEQIGQIVIPRGASPENHIVHFLENTLVKVTDTAHADDVAHVEIIS